MLIIPGLSRRFHCIR